MIIPLETPFRGGPLPSLSYLRLGEREKVAQWHALLFLILRWRDAMDAVISVCVQNIFNK